MDMFDILRGGATPPWQRDPDCEYTAPGSTTESVDCWEDAKWRYVDNDGHTAGLFCGNPEHQPLGRTDLDREYIISHKTKAMFGVGEGI